MKIHNVSLRKGKVIHDKLALLTDTKKPPRENGSQASAIPLL